MTTKWCPATSEVEQEPAVDWSMQAGYNQETRLPEQESAIPELGLPLNADNHFLSSVTFDPNGLDAFVQRLKRHSSLSQVISEASVVLQEWLPGCDLQLDVFNDPLSEKPELFLSVKVGNDKLEEQLKNFRSFEASYWLPKCKAVPWLLSEFGIALAG